MIFIFNYLHHKYGPNKGIFKGFFWRTREKHTNFVCKSLVFQIFFPFLTIF